MRLGDGCGTMGSMRVQWFGGPLDGQHLELPDTADYVMWAEPNRIAAWLARILPTKRYYEARVYEHPHSGQRVINYGYRQRVKGPKGLR